MKTYKVYLLIDGLVVAFNARDEDLDEDLDCYRCARRLEEF